MGVLSLVVLATLSAQAPQSNPAATFADRPTETLVRRAIARHHSQDSAVTDYRARLRYRLSFSLGKRRWARIPIASVEEQEALAVDNAQKLGNTSTEDGTALAELKKTLEG